MSVARVSLSREFWIGSISAIAAASVATYAVLGGDGSASRYEEQVRTLPYVIIFAFVIAAVIFGLMVPWATKPSASRAKRPTIVGLASSIFGFLTIVAFWSGLPIILGAAGATLGQVGRERAQTAGQRALALGAIIIGLIAATLGIAVTIGEKFGI
jgi:membrane protease YdiL (CAAX protease family)